LLDLIIFTQILNPALLRVFLTELIKLTYKKIDKEPYKKEYSDLGGNCA